MSLLNYHERLCEAMGWLAQQRRTIFVGQGVGCAGTTMTDTLKYVHPSQLLEFPVAEDLQCGFCIGLALEGWSPICIYPRWNFLICATNQIVNHLDRIPLYSGFAPRVIVRTAIPAVSEKYDPGPQHDSDFTAAFRLMLRTVRVIELNRPQSIMRAYQEAYFSHRSTLLVERTALYGDNVVPSGATADVASPQQDKVGA